MLVSFVLGSGCALMMRWFLEAATRGEKNWMIWMSNSRRSSNGGCHKVVGDLCTARFSCVRWDSHAPTAGRVNERYCLAEARTPDRGAEPSGLVPDNVTVPIAIARAGQFASRIGGTTTTTRVD
jgi:hypothetical protein